MSISKIKDQVSNAATSIDTTKLEKTATDAKSTLENSVNSVAGSVAGKVEGGVKQLSQKFDKVQDKLNNTTVEGLVDDGAQSLENMATDMVTNAIAGLTSKFGSSVNVSFTEPDSNGVVFPLEVSLDAEGGTDKISGILKLITGLGVDAGSLQKAVIEGSPEGLLNAGKDNLSGKMGAFDANSIKSLADTAITSVTNEIESNINNVANNINSVVSFVSGMDSDGNGDLTISRSSLTNSNRPSDSSEITSAIANVKTATETDLNTLVTETKNIKQNLKKGVSDFENLSGGKDGSEVIKSIQNKSKAQARFTKAEEEYKSIVSQRVSKGSQRGVIQGLSTETLTTVKKDIKKFAPKATDDQINSIISLCQGDAAEFSEAVRLLSRLTGKNVEEIRIFLKDIDTTITKATLPPLGVTVFSEPYVIGSFEKSWNNGTGDPVFPYISSVEELSAEFRNISREVTEVVVHWTETHTNRNIGSEEINRYHLNLDLDGIGYHYVIRRDGSIQRGRPVNIQGQHAPINNHDVRSIGVVFVGGINVPTETPNSEDFLSSDSITRSQVNTFNHFCREIYKVYSGIQIVGHTDIDLVEVDPGFSVINYVETNFGKKSKFTDPTNQEPFTVSEINDQ